MGQTVTWIAPYSFNQKVPGDVDFRVMLTFLEYYTTMLGFVNYKLYHDNNLHYPPKYGPLSVSDERRRIFYFKLLDVYCSTLSFWSNFAVDAYDTQAHTVLIPFDVLLTFCFVLCLPFSQARHCSRGDGWWLELICH